MDKETKLLLLDFLSQYITDKRKELFQKVLNNRTRHIAIVLEDIYQPHNASAVLRSADLTGIQDVHIIENRNTYTLNPEVAMGSSKWLTMQKYNDKKNNSEEAIQHLRNQGYRIVATTPHKGDQLLNEIPLKEKVAVFFGTELTGLSDTVISNADEYLKIPMYGFTESYNISVSAALTMFTLSERLRKSEVNWRLKENEKIDILLEWTKRTIKRSDILEKQFLENLLNDKSG